MSDNQCLRSIRNVLVRIRRFLLVFCSATWELPLSELMRFLQLRRNHSCPTQKGSIHSFHLRKLNRRGLCVREGTTDALVLEDVVWRNSYLPPHALPKTCVIFDLGANIGCCAAHLAEIYPSARMAVVEMEPSNAMVARRNLAQFGNRVQVIEAAVWPKDGKLVLSGKSENAYNVQEKQHHSEEAIYVTSISMLSLMETMEANRVDYIKIDVEGAERQLFSVNPSPWLDRTDALKVEIHDPDCFSEIFAVLKAHGFIVAKDPNHWSTIAAWRQS